MVSMCAFLHVCVCVEVRASVCVCVCAYTGWSVCSVCGCAFGIPCRQERESVCRLPPFSCLNAGKIAASRGDDENSSGGKADITKQQGRHHEAATLGLCSKSNGQLD